jgi:hypothetical protein
LPVSFISCASSASITWERIASRRRPAFSSHLISSIDSSRQSSSRRGESVLPVRHRQAISASHPLPVIFVSSSTDETDLIVLAIAAESWPSKLMGAQFAEESLQESHVCCSLSARARLGGVICSEKWRVNRFDYHAGTLSNYGSAFQVQVTAYLDEFGGSSIRRIDAFYLCDQFQSRVRMPKLWLPLRWFMKNRLVTHYKKAPL